MRRRTRTIILSGALGLAIAAIVPLTASAKPIPYEPDVQSHGQYRLGPSETPYLDGNQGIGIGVRGQRSDERAYPTRLTSSPDGKSLFASDDGRSAELNPYTVTSFGLALLLAIGLGMGVAVWHNRRKLSPA